MEYERRRKELEDAKKQKRKNPEGPSKKRKKRREEAAAQQIATGFPGPMDQTPPGVFDPQNIMDAPLGQMLEGQTPPPLMSPDKEKKKQRNRKTKKEKLAAAVEGAQSQENVVQDNLFETLNLQLKQMPQVPLMEPFVGHTYAICSLAGSNPNSNGESRDSFSLLVVTDLKFKVFMLFFLQ